jgi:hypothetical protein
MKQLSDRLPIILVILFFVLMIGTLPAMADWTQQQKITSTPRGVGAQFGNAVAFFGDTLVVGARFDSTTASQAGAAYVFVRNGTTWTQQAVLLASDGAAGDKFGYSVAIYEDTIVVGAYNSDALFSNGGAAYIFSRTGTSWFQEQKLTAVNGSADDEFGNAVAIEFGRIAVGAHFADLPGNSQAGAVYIFLRGASSWGFTQRLDPNTGVLLGDHFGESVALRGKLVVGAAGDDTPQTAAGAVYVFSQGDVMFFQEGPKLFIPDGTNGDGFGGAVSIDGNTLVGGAREDGPVGGQPSYGAAYVFTFNISTGWQSQAKLTASDGAAFDRFGWSVAVSGDVIAVGAREDDTAVGPDAGSAYIFNRTGNNWSEEQKLTPSDPFNGDRFGSGVALFADQLIVGAPEKALTSPNGQGAAYYYRLLGRAVPFDYEGDGRSDISIFRPSNGQWWLQQSSDNGIRSFQFGATMDKPVPTDFDGDGKTDIGVYRPGTGRWYILRSSDLTFYSIPFGISTDDPVPADYDGDGMADIAVFRAAEGVWYVNRSTGGFLIVQWGTAGDIPVNADYDGDGKSDTAIYRPASGQWWLNRTTAGVVATTFGVGADKAVQADYTGDSKADIAVWRPANGVWYVLRSDDSSFFAIPFGANGDIPVPGDYDGDGKTDFGVFRPDGSNWFIQRSTAGILIQQFGLSTDIPTESSYIH